MDEETNGVQTRFNCGMIGRSSSEEGGHGPAATAVPARTAHTCDPARQQPRPIFAAEEDYRFNLECLGKAAGEYGLAIHAYVLMTNHVHLLATPENEDSLSRTLQSLGRRYVQYFNHAYGRTGTLWEGRGGSCRIIALGAVYRRVGNMIVSGAAPGYCS
jgi:REP element-mobilizing transposase RayT